MNFGVVGQTARTARRAVWEPRWRPRRATTEPPGEPRASVRNRRSGGLDRRPGRRDRGPLDGDRDEQIPGPRTTASTVPSGEPAAKLSRTLGSSDAPEDALAPPGMGSRPCGRGARLSGTVLLAFLLANPAWAAAYSPTTYLPSAAPEPAHTGEVAVTALRVLDGSSAWYLEGAWAPTDRVRLGGPSVSS